MSLHPVLAVLTLVGLQRLAELAYSRRTTARLLASGGRLVRPDGMAAIVAVHATWFAACLLEAGLRGVAFGWWTWAGAALFAAGQALRAWSMVHLGPRWSTRVVVLPQRPLVASGPYRFLRHPIYVGVFLELLGLPLAFGLPYAAAGVAAIHLVALRHRLRLEERALGLAAQPAAPAPAVR